MIEKNTLTLRQLHDSVLSWYETAPAVTSLRQGAGDVSVAFLEQRAVNEIRVEIIEYQTRPTKFSGTV